MDIQYKLTTIDNPYSPFTQFDEWYAFDESQGYHTCSYLARVTHTSGELSQDDENDIYQDAIKEIVRLNITGKYRLVTQKDYSG